MKERLEEAMESANKAFDQVALRNPQSKRGSDGRDMSNSITRIFPFFVVFVIVLWFCVLVYMKANSIPKAIEILCLSFTFCFAVLGAFCSRHASKGIFPFWMLTLYALVLTAVLWLFNNVVGENYYANAITDMLGAIGIRLPEICDAVVGFLGTFAVMLFTSIGVTAVISSYLRKYIPSVLESMNDHARKGTRCKSEKFFLVPEIIDVREVVLEPPATDHIYDFRRSLSITTYLFVLGLLVSSYLFVNPYFLDVMSWKTMLAITLMLSMFTPSLILPWQIFRSIGAKVKSEAHRDYYLWIGAKNRLFTTFTALGVFMMMFLLSVYLGNDASKIVMNYLMFLVPLLITSMMYGFLYCNNFEKEDREKISACFDEMRTGDRSPWNGSRVKEENDC